MKMMSRENRLKKTTFPIDKVLFFFITEIFFIRIITTMIPYITTKIGCITSSIDINKKLKYTDPNIPDSTSITKGRYINA